MFHGIHNNIIMQGETKCYDKPIGPNILCKMYALNTSEI